AATVPVFASSANSSDAEAPPVSTSEITSVEVGHATAAATTRGCASKEARGSGRWAAAATSVATTITRTKASGRAAGPTRRARDIDDLPAGLSDEGPRDRTARMRREDGCSRDELPPSRSLLHARFVRT